MTMGHKNLEPDVLIVDDRRLPKNLCRELHARSVTTEVLPLRRAAMELPQFRPILFVVVDSPALQQLRFSIAGPRPTERLVLLTEWAPDIARAAMSGGYASLVLRTKMTARELARELLVEVIQRRRRSCRPPMASWLEEAEPRGRVG